jgi:hypothetical protein
MKCTRNAFALLFAAVLFAGSGRANAQCGAYGAGLYGGFWDIGRLYSVLAEEAPYFAAFPPVYYSYPVPRTYGYSPFAYPPGVMTPEVELTQPETIENPYFKGEEVPQPNPDEATGTSATVDRTTQARRPNEPLVIVNPFYQSSGAATMRVTHAAIGPGSPRD